MKYTQMGVLLVLAMMGCGPESYREDAEKFVDSTKEVLVEEKDETVVHKSQVLAFQAEMDEQFADSAHSPLLPEDLAVFEALEFFAIDPGFNVAADFKRVVSEPFEMPYKDLTSSNDTYGGGRFIDVLMPENGTVVIDFNKSYNPYCAYNHKYSCPIPPEENFLEVRVTAGVKAWAEH
jgi:uncharacterized protein (DUF1684 family)